jgi:DNA-binding GntR family transcriptional regulator
VTVTRTVLREQVKEILLERILSGDYEPGDRLVETRIAQELGTSQAPVREALRDLESLHFVESEPFRGARVRAVSGADLAEVYPVRAALEEAAARAAARRDDGWLEALEREYAAMLQAAEEGDVRRQVERDAQFHRLIVEASENRTLIAVWESLGIRLRTLITARKTGLDGRRLAEMHEPILDALRARDPEGAGAAVRRHLEHFERLIAKGAP